MKWANDEAWAGRWPPFMGKFIAILNKAHVGTDDDMTALRARVARGHAVDPERVVVEYIPTDIITEG